MGGETALGPPPFGRGVSESIRTRCYRLFFNLFPAYLASGGRVTYIAADWRELRVKVVRSWRTRNYMGTTFGGSMYAAVDPLYAMMLINVLGDEFEVWDKSASIRFRKPVEETLYARCRLSDEEIREIRGLAPGEKSDREYGIDLITAEGEVHATVEKTVHVKRTA